jgi:type IV secretion system protein VirB2
MKKRLFVKLVTSLVLALVLTLIVACATFAASAGMPWEGPLQKILDSIQGPVAKVIGGLMIIGTGVSLYKGGAEGGFAMLLKVVFALSIAFTATSFALPFLGFSGGICF